ncbi:MAG: HNH endonuclease family protein [Thermoproteota archaeon]|nr:HNH endonuclease family protein [Thermoproteota archaeon]
MTLLVGSESMTQFLRHYWLSEIELVRERELYRALRRRVKSNTKARQFMERIRKVANYYAALMNPEHTYWADFPPEVRNYLEALLLFKVTQYRPVALAAMEKEKPEIITKLLRSLMVISLRYTVISTLGTGNLEAIYSDTALNITSGKVKGVEGIFDKLRPAYVDDGRFRDDFAQKNFSNPSIARYVLAEINDHVEGDREKMVAERTGRVTLEHVLPRNPDNSWEGAIPADEELSEYVERIGNLTLLEKGKNRGIANTNFKEKKNKAFSQSSLAINQDIASKTKWTHAQIEERAQRLAKHAVAIWRVDY